MKPNKKKAQYFVTLVFFFFKDKGWTIFLKNKSLKNSLLKKKINKQAVKSDRRAYKS